MGEQKVSRVPPADVELELCVLGAIMLEPREALQIARDELTVESFYLQGHGLIFEACCGLADRGLMPDTNAVIAELKARQSLDKAGGAGVVLDAVNAVASAANIEPHARLVAEKATTRALIRALTQTLEESYRQELTLDELLGQAGQAITTLAGEIARGTAAPLSEAVGASYAGVVERAAEVERARAAGEAIKAVRGVATGFIDLDKLLRGLRPRELTIVAGATSMGKTTFALEVASHAAITAGVPTVIYTLEMGADELADRLLSMHTLTHEAGKLTGVPSQRLDNPELGERDWYLLTRARDRLAAAPLYLRVPARAGMRELRALIRSDIRALGIGLVVIDYLGLIDPGPGDRGRYEQVSNVSVELKRIAREFNVPLLVPHQLSRAPGDRGNKRPMLSDLRDSGSIEQDADAVIGLYREEYYRRQQGLEPQGSGMPTAEAIVLKNRNGPTGTALLYWYESLTRFITKARQ